jgi:Ulp1 family protease
MRTYWNKQGTEILFDITDEDVPKITKIIETMDSVGWTYLKQYLGQIREELINKGKECTLKRTQKDFSENRWAAINGFDINSRFTNTLIEEIEAIMKIKREVAEVENSVG